MGLTSVVLTFMAFLAKSQPPIFCARPIQAEIRWSFTPLISPSQQSMPFFLLFQKPGGSQQPSPKYAGCSRTILILLLRDMSLVLTGWPPSSQCDKPGLRRQTWWRSYFYFHFYLTGRLPVPLP